MRIICFLLQLYLLILIGRIVLSWFPISGEGVMSSIQRFLYGVTEPILYRHFKGKQELFVAIVRSVSDITLKAWQAIVAHENDPIRRIKLICEAIPDHMRRNADAYHVLHGALSTSRDRKVLTVMREHYQQIEKFFAQLVHDGQKAGADADYHDHGGEQLGGSKVLDVAQGGRRPEQRELAQHQQPEQNG